MHNLRSRGGTSSEQFHLFFLLDVISEGLTVSLVPRLLAGNTVLHPALSTGGSVPLPWGWGPRLSLTKHSLVPPTPESHIKLMLQLSVYVLQTSVLLP